MTVHIPILVQPILEGLLEPFRNLSTESPSQWIVDCTLGGGGHTGAFLEALAIDPRLKHHRVLALDQDLGAIEKAQARFSREISEGRLELIHTRFGEARDKIGDRPVLGMMADLGFSSDQIEDASRGLSFKNDGPLDMRLDPTRGQSCREVLAHLDQDEIEKILTEYGEERFSRKIASAIVHARRDGRPPQTTGDLENLVFHAVPTAARHGRIHPATRTFQALRIFVNDELEELETLLKDVILCVRPGGRVAILSFHSLEDRRVKLAFKERDGSFEQTTKKPIEADESETDRNPRSRSAKLRIAQRTK